MTLSELVFDLIWELVKSAVDDRVQGTVSDFFARRKLMRAVENAVAEAAEPLVGFLEREGLTPEQERLLIMVCVDELKPLVAEPEQLFRGSLDGLVVFENLYKDRLFPQAIHDEGLENPYGLLGPRVSTLLCQVVAPLANWELHKAQEDYRRFDEIGSNLRAIFEKLERIAPGTTPGDDPVLKNVRRAMAQRVHLQIDLTSLRGDKGVACSFDALFVHPALRHPSESPQGDLVLSSEDDTRWTFLKRGERGIVVGGPGAGKSTWSVWLWREAYGERWSGLAVRVELRALKESALPSRYDLVRSAVGAHYAEDLDANRLRAWLDAGRILFILDGFDELSPERRDQAMDWLAELAEAAPACPIVVTSRPLSTDHLDQLGTRWTTWQVDPFDHERIVRYITAWHLHAPLLHDASRSVDAKALASQWEGDDTLKPLTGNPLLLATLLMVHHLDGELPSGRAALYSRYVDGMLGLWDQRRGVVAGAVSLNLEQKKKILAGLALHMHLFTEDRLGEDQVREVVARRLEELRINEGSGAVLDTLRERSGLLIGPGTYEFVHKSVAEFLIAELAVDGVERDPDGQRIDRMYLFQHRHEDRWKTVLFLWAGLAPVREVETFIEQGLAHQTEEEFSLGLGLLLDQFDRLKRTGLPRSAFEQLCKASGKYWLNNNYHGFYFIENSPNDNLKVTVMNMTLRSINTGVSSLYILIHKLIDEKIIYVNDSGLAESNLLCKGLWLNNILGIRSFPDWLEWWLLYDSIFNKDRNLRLIGLEWSVKSFLQQENSHLNIKAIHEKISETELDLAGCISLQVLSIGLENKILRKTISIKRIQSVIRTSAVLSKLPVNSVWLFSTISFYILGYKVDLLLEFEKTVRALLADKSLPPSEEVDQVLVWLEALKEERARLLAENPPRTAHGDQNGLGEE